MRAAESAGDHAACGRRLGRIQALGERSENPAESAGGQDWVKDAVE